jgi:hypothetical protein
VAETVWCPPDKTPCDCVLADLGERDSDEPPHCAEVPEPKPPVAGWHVYHLHVSRDEGYDYLLDEHAQLVDVIGSTSGHDRESTQVKHVDLKTIGGHQVLRLEVESVDSTSKDAIVTNDRATICVVGDAKVPTRCPLRDVLISSNEQTLEIGPIADDGTVAVKLVKGASDAAVGTHRLW